MAPSIRVKLEFRKKVKVLVHIARNWDSMDYVEKVIFENFPEVEKAIRRDEAANRLDVKYADSAGDLVTIENDKDVQIARRRTATEDSLYDLQLQIDVIREESIVVANSGVDHGKSEVLRSGLSGQRSILERGQRGDDPLYALQSVVLKLEEGTAKNELTAIVNRLVDQRRELQNLLFIHLP